MNLNICFPEPVDTECCVGNICFECRLSLPDSEQFVHDIEFSAWFKILALLAVGVWNILSFRKTYKLYTNSKYHHYFPIMRLNNIIYAVGTAIFIFSKTYYQLSKPTFILAAIHNLCEWVFTAFAFYQTRQERLYCIFGAFCYILTIIGVIITVLNQFEQYALAEQVTGIAMDFMLPIVWFILYRQNREKKEDKEDKKDQKEKDEQDETMEEEEEKTDYNFGQMYLIAFASHSVHLFFTILPVVIDNVTRNQNELFSRILQFVFFFSVPLTHILYTRFTTLHEQFVDLPNYTKNNNNDDDEPRESVSDYADKHCVQFPSFGIIQTSFRRMLFWYICSAIMGLFPLIVIPQAVMRLNNGQYCHEEDVVISDAEVSAVNAVSDNFIIGTTLGHVHDGLAADFEHEVLSKNLIKHAREYEGNVFYYFAKAAEEENTYLFVEAWESIEAVQKWINSPYVTSVFNNYTFTMFDGELELNSFIPLVQNDDNVGKAAANAVSAVGDNFIITTVIAHVHDGFADEFVHEILSKNLTKHAREYEGNIFFYFTKSAKEENTYFVVEAWESMQALQKWSISPAHDAVFNNYTYPMFEGELNNFIPFGQNEPQSFGIPNNMASRLLLSSETPLEFVHNVQYLQSSNASSYAAYGEVAPYFFTADGEIIFDHNITFKSLAEIQSIYGSWGGSETTMHSFLMDPIVEGLLDDNTTLITMTSSVYQQAHHLSNSKGCDYSYPLYASLEITNTFPFKMKKLTYNMPKYAVIEQPKVLTNCQYLSDEEKQNLSSGDGMESILYSMWSGLHIINDADDMSFGELWKPYFAENSSLVFDGDEYMGMDAISQFHDDFSLSVFGGFNFYVLLLIENEGFITIHLRGSVFSSDLKLNYNHNFRMVIEYHLDDEEKILSANYHIDTEQLDGIKERFDIQNDDEDVVDKVVSNEKNEDHDRLCNIA